ncbi:MAG: zinc-ribbon domain-containing protein [Rhodospirillales bacterium]|nr:zinc-ribbon domain-containing protein [Rhodospirillales bacterium]
MRIVCPDCQTQYDVADKLIGGNSRRLRCGQCGHGWRFEPEDPAEIPLVLPVQLVSQQAAPVPAAETDEVLSRHFGQPSDDEAKAEVQAALRDEALSHPHQETHQEATAQLPEPVAATDADRFADIVRAARNNEMELEPERTRQRRSPKAASRLVVPLLLLLILAVVFLERHVLMHALHLS